MLIQIVLNLKNSTFNYKFKTFWIGSQNSFFLEIMLAVCFFSTILTFLCSLIAPNRRLLQGERSDRMEDEEANLLKCLPSQSSRVCFWPLLQLMGFVYKLVWASFGRYTKGLVKMRGNLKIFAHKMTRDAINFRFIKSCIEICLFERNAQNFALLLSLFNWRRLLIVFW